MHGFFVDLRLYEKARAIANPFEFDEYKKQMVRKKIEEKRASRISARKTMPKVNRALATELAEKSDDDEKRTKKKKKAINIMKDERFKTMFEDPEFEIDESTVEYKLHHPSEVMNY
jgi:ribosome biogenesis protein ENP2